MGEVGISLPMGRTAPIAALSIALAGCGGSAGYRLDASALPSAAGWARAVYVTLDCRRAARLQAPDFAVPSLCRDEVRLARADRAHDRRLASVTLRRRCDPRDAALPTDGPVTRCIQVVATDVSCGGRSDGRRRVSQDRHTLWLYLERDGGRWLVADLATFSEDERIGRRPCHLAT